MAIYNPWTGPTVKNVVNANPIGDFKRNISDAYTGSLNKILDEPLAHKLDVDTRGMYSPSPLTPEIFDYRSDIGTIGNLRHATTTAQYKDKIAQGLVPEHMKNIGAKPGFVENLIGGVGANILGLGHEFEGLTKDWGQIKDPNWWRATGEDVLANLYGSITGKTGVSEQEIYDSMLGNFIYDEGIMSNVLDWGTITGDKEKKGMSLQRFKNLYQIQKNRQKQDMQRRIRQGEAAEAAKKAAAISTGTTGGGGGTTGGGGVSNINIQKRAIGMPEHLTYTPPKKTYVAPPGPHGNGDKGGMPQGGGGGMGKGKDPGGGTAGSPFNRGGLANLYRYGGFSG